MYVDLYLPEGQVIYLDNSTATFLYDVDNVQKIYDDDMPDHYYMMTKDELNCLDCLPEEINTENDVESFNMKIDEKGVRIEIQDEEKEKAKVIINKNGLEVKSSKDSI